MQNLFIGDFASVSNFDIETQQPKVDRFYAELVRLEYCKYAFIGFSIVLPLFLVKCTWCPLQKCRLPWAKVRRAVRNFREKYIGSTFIHAICSIIVLSYGDLVAISMRVFIESVAVISSECCKIYSLADGKLITRSRCSYLFKYTLLRVLFPFTSGFILPPAPAPLTHLLSVHPCSLPQVDKEISPSLSQTRSSV